MTYDVIAVTRELPDRRSLVAGMLIAGEHLRVREDTGSGIVQLCADDGTALVRLDSPILVRVPGEIDRLLGPGHGERLGLPVWWVEAHAPGGRPEAARLARRFAAEAVRRLSGVVWPPLPEEHR